MSVEVVTAYQAECDECWERSALEVSPAYAEDWLSGHECAPDEHADDCLACDASLASCAADPACCEDCSHRANR